MACKTSSGPAGDSQCGRESDCKNTHSGATVDQTNLRISAREGHIRLTQKLSSIGWMDRYSCSDTTVVN